MLTNHQEQDLEKAIIGYFISKKYYHSLSAFAQESPVLRDCDYISLSEKASDSPSINQINILFSKGEGSNSIMGPNNTAYTNISVSYSSQTIWYSILEKYISPFGIKLSLEAFLIIVNKMGSY